MGKDKKLEESKSGDSAYALSEKPRPKCQECGRFVSDKELKKVPKDGVPWCDKCVSDFD